MEGVMMRGRKSAAVAIRRPDDSVYLHEEALNPRLYQNRLFRLPFLRGLLLLWEMLVLGTRLMTFSANIATGALNANDHTGQPATDTVEGSAVGAQFIAPKNETGDGKSLAEELETPLQIGGITLVVTLLISLGFAVLVFFVGPLFLANLLRNQIGDGWLNLVFEGVIRLTLLVGYIYLIGRIPDIQRVFC